MICQSQDIKEKHHQQQKPIGLETKTLPLKLKFLTFQSLCLTSCPSFSNNLLPYFIRRLLIPATAVDIISSLSVFRIWNGGYWCSRSRKSSPRSFFLRNHRKKTMPRMVGSQCFVQGFPASLGSFFFSCVITRAGGLGWAIVCVERRS